MIVDLVNISHEDIERSYVRCVEESDSLIIYLQNSGDKNHNWSNEKFRTTLEESLDD